MGKRKGAGDLPFSLGETLFGHTTPSLDKGNDFVGRIYYLDDLVPAGTSNDLKQRSGREKAVMAVRNMSGGTLYPKRLVSFRLDNGVIGYTGEVDGHTNETGQYCAVVDDMLPASGVRDKDIFFVIIAGPATVLLPDSGTAFGGDISVGSPLVSATINATSGSTVAGRVGLAVVGATAAPVAFNLARNLLGTALGAATTGQTGEELLICVEQGRVR